jgi:lipoprotein-releasing system ATP-binding protein
MYGRGHTDGNSERAEANAHPLIGDEPWPPVDALACRRVGKRAVPRHDLFTAFTTLENVMVPMLGDDGSPSDERRQRVAELIDGIGLAAWHSNPAGNAIGSQQQGVAPARALAVNPPLRLADRPTSNLDTKSNDAVFESLRRPDREHGATALCFTRDAALVDRCDMTIQVVDGEPGG